jgi:pyruvate dehydrogenase complex dehydrogenase (E1) component
VTAWLDTGPADRVRLRPLASGPAARPARQAAARLAAERSSHSHPDQTQRVSHLRRTLGDGSVPVIAVRDYVSAPPDQLAGILDGPMSTLGTDGYGPFDSRESPSHAAADGTATAALGSLGGRVRPEPLQAVPGRGRTPAADLVA